MSSDYIDPAFAYHKLNGSGQTKAKIIAMKFTELLNELTVFDALMGREGAIVKTKLEEACFFAKKSMATQSGNQET